MGLYRRSLNNNPDIQRFAEKFLWGWMIFNVVVILATVIGVIIQHSLR